MTTTRRGRRSPSRGRTSRRVWVNTLINTTVVIDTVQIVDLLGGAENFMLFDSTILGVKIPWLSYTMVTSATVAIREFAYYLITGLATLDAVDFTPPRTTGVGPAMMHFGGISFLSGAIANVTSNLVSGVETVDIKAKRRFKENDTSLFLVMENASEVGDTAIQLSGYIRTLLLIP